MSKAACLIFVLMVCSLTTVRAQLYSISKDELDISGYEHVEVIGQDEDGIFLLQSNLSLFSSRNRIGLKNRKYKIAYYDRNLSYRWFMEIRPIERAYTVEKILFADNSVFVFYSSFDKQSNRLNFKIEKIDGSGNAGKYDENGFDVLVDPSFNIENIDVIMSADHSKFAFVIACTDDSKSRFALSFAVADRTLKEVNAGNTVLPFDINTYDAYQNVVSNGGDFAHLGFVTEQSEENRKVLIEHFELLLKYAGSSAFKPLPLQLTQKQIVECYLSFDEKNKKLIVSGFYFDSSTFLSSGIFINKIGADSLIDGANTLSSPLSENIQVKLVSDREKDFGRGLNNYSIQKIIMRNDGGAVILAESNYINQYSYYDYFTQTFNNRIEYHFDNVVVISVNGDGTIDWNKVLRKNQESRDDMGLFSSYCPMIRQQEIVMFYNNNFHKNNEIIGEAVTNEGTQYQVKVSRPIDHLTILPRSGKQIAANEVVLPCMVKRKLMLLKIAL